MTPGGVLTPTDVAVATFCGVLAFFVYVRTMYPGIFEVGDAAKFAFVGKILGIPHAPGYPLYVLVSHLFSYVPWGTLAHRMNGLSALFGAIAVALAYVAGRSLGFGRTVAIATALAIGFGRAFWSKALYAKGYTLNAALVTAGVLMLLRWEHTRRRSYLYSAIAIFALSLGNHLIVISLVPALVFYAIATDPRTALSARTILLTVGMVLVSLCQYLLILVRTLQHAPYLEASATNLRELIQVMTARRWAHEIGAYPVDSLLDGRIPTIAALVSREMTTIGLVLAAAGFVVLVRRRWQAALLCGIGALGVLALTTIMSSNEDEGFLLPAFVFLWLLAGAGLQSVATFSRYVAGATVSTVVALAAATVPATLLWANYRANDHHGRTFETRYFDALFEMLPDKSAVIDDKYQFNMLMKYKLLGEDAAGGRDIGTVGALHEAVESKLNAGYRIFASTQGKRELEKFGYQFSPVQLFDTRFPDYLQFVGNRWTVVFAATPSVSAQLRSNRHVWRSLGVSDELVLDQKRSVPVAAIAIKGSGGPAIESNGALAANVSVVRGTPVGNSGLTASASVEASADRNVARLVVDGVERARSERGAVLGLVDPAGRAQTFSLDPASGLRVPMDMGPIPMFKLTGASLCKDVGNAGWQDISTVTQSGTLSLRIDNFHPFLSRTVFYLAGSAPVRPHVTEISGSGVPKVSAGDFRPDTKQGRDALAKATAADDVQLPAAFGDSDVISRLEFAVDDGGDYRAVQIGFGMQPTHALVHSVIDGNNAKRATVCGSRPLPQ